VNHRGERVEDRTVLELESTRHEEVGDAFEQCHERRYGRDVAGRAGRVHPFAERSRDVGERLHAHRTDVPIIDVALHPRAQDRPVAAVRQEELVQKGAQLGVPLGVGPDRPETPGEGIHLLCALGCERPEQVFLVREVEVERPV